MAQALGSTEKVLIDELFLTEYLGAMLKATPPMELDLPPAWVTAQEPTVFSSISLSRRNENSPSEQLAIIEALRSENEKLKFSGELAKIDAEVLREENQKLQGELKSLKVDHDGTQKTINELTNCNKSFKTSGELAQNNIEMLREENQKLQNRVSSLATDLADAQEMLHELQSCNKSLMAELTPLRSQVTTLQIELKAQQEQHAEQTAALMLSAIQQAVAADMTANTKLTELPVCPPSQPPQHPEHNEITSISSEERRIALGALYAHNETVVHSPDSKGKDAVERAESKRKLEMIAQVAADSPRKRKPFQPGSKIVKPTEPQLDVVIRSVSDSARSTPVSVQQFIQPVQQVDKPATQGDTEATTPCSSSKSALNPDDIKLESVPASKVTKRKNADNYLQMQQDAEGQEVPKSYSITVT